MLSKWRYYAGVLVLLCSLAACGQRSPVATPETVQEVVTPAVERESITGQAYVSRIEILRSATTPVEVTVVAVGDLPDTCTAIAGVTQGRDMAQSTLWVAVETVRAPGDHCENTVVPFEERIPLDVYGLVAGTYAVNVNGATGMFMLVEDNVPPPLEGTAAVERVTMQVSETDPTKPVAVIEGVLPDACTQVSDVSQGIDVMRGTVWVEILTSRPRDAACAAQPIAFAETVVLNTHGLLAGSYTLEAQGVTQAFELTVDNLVITPTPTPSPTPTAEPVVAPTDAPPTPTVSPDDSLITESIRLASMDLRVTGTSPVRATVTAKGVLPDTCSRPGPIEQRVDGDARTIWVTVNISRPRDAVCETANRPFEEQFELNLTGLPAGTYTVDVNGIAGSIMLGVNN